MKLRWVPAVLVAVVGGAVLSGCGTTQANSPTTGSSTGAGSPTASGAYGALGVSGAGPSSPSAGSSATPQASGASPSHTKSAHPSSTMHSVAPVNTDTASSDPHSGGTSFTVPAIPGNNIVSAYGSYTKINAERVKVTICAKQTGAAFSVGALALAYNTSGADKNVGAVVLTGPGNTSCGTITFLFYSAHLRVHAFIGGNNGTITTTGPVLDLY